jgi:hypothetical protein
LGDNLDLRITTANGQTTVRSGLTVQDLVENRDHLLGQSLAGASIEVRAYGLQLLPNVSAPNLSRAVSRGFEPAAAVETAPGRYDVWLRHDSQGPTRLYLERIARLEFGLPSAGSPTGFGRLALSSKDLTYSSGSAYPRARELAGFLSVHMEEVHRQLATALVTAKLPSLEEFRALNPGLRPREVDLRWAELALEQGLSRPDLAMAIALTGSRRDSPDAGRSLRYAARVVSSVFRETLKMPPLLAQSSALQTLATATAIPVQALRVILGFVKLASKLVVRL